MMRINIPDELVDLLIDLVSERGDGYLGGRQGEVLGILVRAKTRGDKKREKEELITKILNRL